VSGGIAPHILNQGYRWRWVVSFTTRLLYPRGKSLRYPLESGWAPEVVWTQWRRIKFPALVGNRNPVVQSVA